MTHLLYNNGFLEDCAIILVDFLTNWMGNLSLKTNKLFFRRVVEHF